MAPNPDPAELARQTIDILLTAADWHICDSNEQTYGFWNHKSAGLQIWTHEVHPKNGGAWMLRRKNVVLEFNHEMGVAYGFNINDDVYRIRTQITEGDSTIEAGYSMQT